MKDAPEEATDESAPESREDSVDLDALREQVEREYDFDNFGPADMRQMSATEWEAAFDPDTWITGRELLDRVEADLQNRIASRDVFAVLERVHDPDRIIAYSDEGYAVVYPDGSVAGEGTVLRDVKPTVVLCSLESYDIDAPPDTYDLPDPEEIESGTGEFGNTLLQAVALAQLLAGVGILLLFLFSDLIPISSNGELNIAPPVAGVLFMGIGIVLLLVVANARLSDRFRAEEYRDRLRAAGLADGDRPAFVPFDEIINEGIADPSSRAPLPDEDDATPSDTANSSDE